MPWRPGHTIALAALALSVLAAGVQSYRLALEQRAHAITRGEHAALAAAADASAREAIAQARVEEQRRVHALQGVIHETEQKLARARADAAGAADAGHRLRQRIAAITAACGATASDPTAADPGNPARTTADLLADVQRRIDEASERIAGFADQAHAAGRACQQSYNALTVTR